MLPLLSNRRRCLCYRMKVDVNDDDDDETAGCLSMLRTHSSSRSGHMMSYRSKSIDSMSSASSSPHSKFTEKMKRIFHPSHSDHVVTSKPTPAAKNAQPPRRKYMRVVTDRHAPPPDKSNDNPNIIAHYSQDYLQKYYAEKNAKSGAERVPLPYVVSDTSILKKSSTDPTSDRRTAAALESTIGGSEKHATFNDVVMVFDSFQHTVTKERLHGSIDESDAESGSDSIDTSGDGAVKDFFLESDSLPATTELTQQPEMAAEDVQLAQEVQTAEAARQVLDDVDGPQAEVKPQSPAAVRRQPQAMQNIFSTFAAPPDLLGNETHERRAAPMLRKVDLKSVVEQSLANGGGLRDE